MKPDNPPFAKSLCALLAIFVSSCCAKAAKVREAGAWAQSDANWLAGGGNKKIGKCFLAACFLFLDFLLDQSLNAKTSLSTSLVRVPSAARSSLLRFTVLIGVLIFSHLCNSLPSISSDLGALGSLLWMTFDKDSSPRGFPTARSHQAKAAKERAAKAARAGERKAAQAEAEAEARQRRM